MNDEKSGTIRKDASALEDLIPRLDRMLELFEMELGQSSATLALMRSKLNDTLYAGTKIFDGAAGQWYANFDFAVPFASVGFSDSLSMGPFVLSLEGDGGSTGVGKYTTSLGSSGEIPMNGTHLTITSTAATQPRLFVALFTATQPLRVN